MSTPPPGSVRHRRKKHVNAHADGSTDTDTDISLSQTQEPQPKAEWDYRIACAIITIAAFVTRFWHIGHPDQVVFDEVHFGKVQLDLKRSFSHKKK